MAGTIAPNVTADSLRSVLGLSAVELSDNALADQFLDEALRFDLADRFPAWQAWVAAGQAPAPSAIDAQRFRALKLYSLWFCAARVAYNWPSFLQQLADGTTKVARFVDLSTLSAVADYARDQRDYWAAALAGVVEAGGAGPPGTKLGRPSIGSLVTPSFDPITNQ